MNRPKVTEEKILAVANTTLDNARQNVAQMSRLGVTAELLDDLETRIDAAAVLPSEIANRVVQKGFTRAKNSALTDCVYYGRELRTRLGMAFGEQSEEAKSFPSQAFNDAVDSEIQMLEVMDALIDLAGKYPVELATVGQTEEELAKGSQLRESLRQANQAQELKKDWKKSATQERYSQFHELYSTVNRINKVGRMVFKDDPARRSLFESKWRR